MEETVTNGMVSQQDEPLSEKAVQSMKTSTQGQHPNSKWRCDTGGKHHLTFI
jgi:hypothetical protein